MTRPAARIADELLSTANPRHDHPLSPSSHPGMGRRISSSVTTDRHSGYFDGDHAPAEGSRQRRATTQADLLGVGPSRKLGKSAPAKEGQTAPELGIERSRSRRSWRVFLQSLSQEELAVIDTNFDAMTDDQLRAYVGAFESPSRSSHRATESQNISSSSTPATADTPAPTSPLPIPSTTLSQTDGTASPLFPPSPPPGETRPDLVEHPLRILSRAVRELREVVEGLEVENEKLRLMKEAGGVSGQRRRRADQVSIHEGLSEALATSLNEDRSHVVPATPSIRSLSPGPSIRRGKSPAGSVRTVPAVASSTSPAPSLYNVKSAEPPAPPASSTTRRNNANRSSWTSGLWIWSGGTAPRQTKSRPRKGSVGSTSVISQAGALGNVVEDASLAAEDELDDEEAWRKGDGGSSPAFRAILLATRIITPDPASILISPDIPSTSLVAYLAHSLVSIARDEGIVAKDPPGRRRANTASQPRSRAASVISTDRASVNSAPSGTTSKGYGDQAIAATASLGRSLLSSVSGATIRAKPLGDDQPAPARPSLLSRVSSSRPFPTTAVSDVPIAPQISNTSSQSASADAPTLPSVEMASIVPDENRPPTVLLSRRQLGSFFQSSKSVPTLRTATRFKGSEPPLTDRYGFIYDVHHASMLKDANAAGTAAPAPLNGTGFHTPAEPEGEGWIDRQRRKSQERPSVSRSSTSSSLHAQIPSPRRSLDASGSTLTRTSSPSTGTVTPTREASGRSHPDVRRVRGSGSISVSMNPSPPRVVTAKDTLTVAARGSSSLHSRAVIPTDDPPPYSTDPSTTRSPGSASLALPLPPENPALPSRAIESQSQSSRATVSSLLDRLTGLHDLQQQERKQNWDDFLRARRTAAKAKSNKRGAGVEDMANGGPGLLGVSEMGRGEEWKAFLRLVRGGIPLAYRSDIWAECSGAKDMMVPGEYAEIQTVHRDDTSPFLAEIEKDVTRTFPGNIYFGGDGPGVAKLRRVLVAYSWYNPEVGYCQGMNMLAATLLLTHTDEEQAYWTLVSILSRILPSGYYTPDLLSSRADQLVLADLVALHVPKVHHHLVDELGVDLSTITFGWFLSLFTDCLPVETLFRVWDVFFVDGHATLFRIACSILKMHEPDILACESVGDLFTLVSTMTSRLWAADKLIAMQHGYRPIIKASDIRIRCERRVAELSAQAGDL